jgi:hypothetical protein
MRNKRLPGPNYESHAHETRKDELAYFILENIGLPIDKLALAAILETYGISDEDAAAKYGKSNVFDLADEIYHRCRLLNKSLS